MRAVIQRVSHARVVIEGQEHSRIGQGILVLLGVEKEDTEQDAGLLARRIVELRIFEDEAGKMNRSLMETGGQMLDRAEMLFRVPSRQTPRIQETHILLGHIICELVDRELFPEAYPAD